ncbi:MAG: hypothetical protein GTO18_05685 [Anaerolineales bacterium]|nr:hypothetical protein [Anaerolineales bacterium]
MKFLSACSKTIAAFFMLAFILTAVIAIFAVTAEWQLFNPNTYKRVLIEERVYQKLPGLAARQIGDSLTYNPCRDDPERCEAEGEGEASTEDGEGGPPDYIQNLTPNHWEALLADLLPPSWLQEQTEKAIDQLFEYLDSNDSTLSISVDLTEMKQRLMGEEGVEIILDLIRSQPTCTASEIIVLTALVLTGASPEELLICSPPDVLLEEITPIIDETLDLVVMTFPDELELTRDFDTGDESDSSSDEFGFNTPLSMIRTTRLGLRWSFMIPIACLLLVALFGVRSKKGFLRWWGLSFLLTGIITLVLSLIALPSLNWTLDTFVLHRIPDILTPALVDTGLGVVRAISRTVIRPTTFIAIILLVIGGLMLFISRFTQFPTEGSEEQVQSPTKVSAQTSSSSSADN